MRLAKALVAAAVAGASAISVVSIRAAISPEAEQNWPMWRGPYAAGTSRLAKPPVEWSETKNVRWKVEIPGRGSASPVVWGDRIFVQTAIPASAPSGDASHTPRGALQPR